MTFSRLNNEHFWLFLSLLAFTISKFAVVVIIFSFLFQNSFQKIPQKREKNTKPVVGLRKNEAAIDIHVNVDTLAGYNSNSRREICFYKMFDFLTITPIDSNI